MVVVVVARPPKQSKGCRSLSFHPKGLKWADVRDTFANIVDVIVSHLGAAAAAAAGYVSPTLAPRESGRVREEDDDTRTLGRRHVLRAQKTQKKHARARGGGSETKLAERKVNFANQTTHSLTHSLLFRFPPLCLCFQFV